MAFFRLWTAAAISGGGNDMKNGSPLTGANPFLSGRDHKQYPVWGTVWEIISGTPFSEAVFCPSLAGQRLLRLLLLPFPWMNDEVNFLLHKRETQQVEKEEEATATTWSSWKKIALLDGRNIYCAPVQHRLIPRKSKPIQYFYVMPDSLKNLKTISDFLIFFYLTFRCRFLWWHGCDHPKQAQISLHKRPLPALGGGGERRGRGYHFFFFFLPTEDNC